MATRIYHLLTVALLLDFLHSTLAQNQVTPLLEYTLTEEQPSSQYLGNLLVQTGLNFTIPPEYQKDTKFSFHTSSAQYEEYFTIEDGTGLFRTHKTLDRETLPICQLINPCIFNITITVLATTSESTDLYVYIIRIQVKDINDHKPTFAINHTEKQISETRSSGTLLDIPAAIDKDSPAYGIQSYRLVQNSNQFELDSGSGSGGSSGLKLKLVGDLNREAEPFYSVQVLAIDGGTPANTGTMTVDIIVTDANDNYPVFDNHTYHVTIEENTQIGTTILQVHAEDHDSGENGLISYTFREPTAEAIRNVFEVEESTGSLKIIGEVDFDGAFVQKEYNIGVIASDNGESALTDYATVYVHVTDVNDITPDIVLNTDDDSGTVFVSENLKVDSFVTHISVIDGDSGDNGKVLCLLNDPFFLLNPLPYDKEYQLTTQIKLNREQQEVYAVTIVCEDLGDPPRIEERTIQIMVMDQNDHAPSFDQHIYPIIIRENNQLGIQISHVQATDRDVGENARISYSIVPPYNELLAVDGNNGFIYTQSLFDYETQRSYNITVVATDHGTPALSDTATLLVTVMDTNDHPPKFNQSHYIFGTLENQDAGTEVGIITAMDIDSEPYNEITYTLDITSPDSSSFRIAEPRVGNITLRKGLDREIQHKYTFSVIASNAGYSLHTVTNVTIYVGDENDNAPMIDFPTPDNYSVQVSSYADKASLIAQIRAHDDDAGRNSYLQYSILAGNVAAIFTINPNTGELFVNKSLEQYGDQNMMLSLLVKDRGEPPLYSVGDLNIFINDSEVIVSTTVVTTRKTTNVQLVIILCLSVLAIALFLAVLIVLLTMRRKKANSVKKAEMRYNVDIAPTQVFTMTSGGELRASRESVLDNPTVRTKDHHYHHHTDSNGNENPEYDRQIGGPHPPPYSEALNSPQPTYVSKEVKPGSRKVHFAETDSAYDSLDKELEEQNSAESLQLTHQGGTEKGGRPLYMEQHRQRLLYGSLSASPVRTRNDLKIKINDNSPHHGDAESDQGSSIDSGRGPSEDEQSRLNTSLQGNKYISLLPDPHQRTYPDLVKCSCGSHCSGGGNINSRRYPKDTPPHRASHKKGCPQHHSPPYTSKKADIDTLHDFQNLLGLPPKTYNKKPKTVSSSSNKPQGISSSSTKPVQHHGVELPGIVVSSSSGDTVDSAVNHHHQVLPTPRSHSPHVHTYGGNSVNNQFTQQCYHDIAQKKAAASTTAPTSVGLKPPVMVVGRQRNSLSRDSTSTWRDDSDGESDGGSTTTSGSFEVGSIDTVVERDPNTIHIAKIHQVYV